MKLENLPFKLETLFAQTWFRLLKLRPKSDPYISGDSFRAVADFIIEEDEKKFNVDQVSAGDILFCDGWILESFLRGPAKTISVPFVLLAHNSDPNRLDTIVDEFPTNLMHLFSNNVLFSHPKVTGLPIGLENAAKHYNGVVSDFQRIRKKTSIKIPRILFGFTVGTNYAVRQRALEDLQNLKTADRLERVNSRKYRKIAAGYQFIASPPGNGEDCHRTWEAIYLRSVPIVLRSKMTEQFENLGLPLWIVDSYSELKDFSETELELKYKTFLDRFDHPAIWMPYWKALIEKVSMR